MDPRFLNQAPILNPKPKFSIGTARLPKYTREMAISCLVLGSILVPGTDP